MRVCISNLKGGVGKTKTAMHVALGLSRTGRTLLVDVDPGQSSAFHKVQAAGEWWPSEQCRVIECDTGSFKRRVLPLLDGYAHLVIDTSPKNELLARQAMEVSDGVIIPAAPTDDDMSEVPHTFAIAAAVDKVHPLWAAVLLTQVNTGWLAGRHARAMLDKYQYPAFAAHIRHLSRYQQRMQASALHDLGDYEAVLNELMEEEK